MTSSPAPDLDELERTVERGGPTDDVLVSAWRLRALLIEVRAAREAAAGSRPMLARAARKYLAVVNERYHGRATWGDVATADADLQEILDADP